ncbi:MAG: dolichol-P-glucose synthetase [Cyanobacteria bacterium RYN_339]|nr:dolichol-P-glucose synthetase [Cyanobacteria bacterium RYN_339]
MELGIQADQSAASLAVTCEPVYFTLVIPAYNEAARLPRTIAAVIAELAERPYRSEVLLVLDGCTDDTAAHARAGWHGNCEIRVIDNAVNRGKGACVRQGMLAAGGRYCFFTDADLSYPLHQLEGFLAVLVADGGVAIACRDASVARYQRPLRRLVTRLSRWVMTHLVVPGVADTQAGLKGFTREVARDLFATQRLTGFGFDAELLHIAHMRGYPIRPLPVEWEDVPGSKIRLGRDVSRMALELVALAANRLLGRYRRPRELTAVVPEARRAEPALPG